MIRVTPEQFAERITRLPAALKTAAERGSRKVFDRIAARAVGTMRASGGPPIPNHLTLRTGKLARAVRGRTPNSVERVKQHGRYVVALEKGVRGNNQSPGGIPGARLHELGGTVSTARGSFTMPARPYLRPAMKASRLDIQRILSPELDKALTRTIQTGTA